MNNHFKGTLKLRTTPRPPFFGTQPEPRSSIGVLSIFFYWPEGNDERSRNYTPEDLPICLLPPFATLHQLSIPRSTPDTPIGALGRTFTRRRVGIKACMCTSSPIKRINCSGDYDGIWNRLRPSFLTNHTACPSPPAELYTSTPET